LVSVLDDESSWMWNAEQCLKSSRAVHQSNSGHESTL
jgi:hypothetical protein